MSKTDYTKYTTNNFYQTYTSKKCTCINCGKIFNPQHTPVRFYLCEFNDTTLKEEYTALCPFCYESSIVPDSMVQNDPKILKKWYFQTQSILLSSKL